VMNGFRKELVGKILGLDGHIVVNRIDRPFDDFIAVARRLRTVPAVTSAIPLVEGQVMASSQTSGTASFGNVRGISEANLKSLKLVAGNIQQGTLDGFDNQTAIALGERLAEILHVGAGDTVTLIGPKGACTPFGCLPQTKTYPVSAVFKLGMSEYDKIMIFMPLAEAQKFFQRDNTVDAVEVTTNDPETVAGTERSILALEMPGLYLRDWKKRNETFIRVLDIEASMMFLILSLIVIVAAFNVISGLMMLVKDKGRDIGILRTMGATKGAVMRIFLITGASIGVVGTLAGFIVGIVVTKYIEEIRQFVMWVSGKPIFDPNFYYLSRMPAEMNPWETGGIVAMGLLLAVLATLYPSWRASRLDPVEALRYG
jgi:lipoprotein-releasing system permease protein